MKSTLLFRWLSLFLCLLLVSILLSSCESQGSSDGSSESPVTKLRFTFVNPQKQLNFWNDVEKGISDASRDLGVDTLLVGPPDIDEAQQILDIETAIASDVDGILTMPLESEEFTSVINKSVDQGIPFICIGGDSAKSKRIAFYGSDNYLAGKIAGEEAAKLMNGTATIGIISTSLTIEAVVNRMNGFMDAIKNYPEMNIVEIVDSNADPIIAAEKTILLIDKFKEINLLFGTAGNDGPGIGNALEELGLAGRIKVVALDDTPENLDHVKNNRIQVLIAQNAYAMGYNAVKGLYDYISGRKIDELNYTNLVVVTKVNLDTYK